MEGIICINHRKERIKKLDTLQFLFGKYFSTHFLINEYSEINTCFKVHKEVPEENYTYNRDSLSTAPKTFLNT